MNSLSLKKNFARMSECNFHHIASKLIVHLMNFKVQNYSLYKDQISNPIILKLSKETGHKSHGASVVSICLQRLQKKINKDQMCLEKTCIQSWIDWGHRCCQVVNCLRKRRNYYDILERAPFVLQVDAIFRTMLSNCEFD